MKRLLIALLGATFLAGALALGGCSGDNGDGNGNGNGGNGTEDSTSTSPANGNDGTFEGEVIPVAFTNEEGQIVCPMMGTVMASAEEAFDHEDFDGKRYYFCCGVCPENFRADPEKYKDGRPADDLDP
ncbi:MAG: YHS domain-containing protein [Armatimonadetes bacterium]|nr:YHS domain-containing protein [Armatimonadota bacterium]